MYFSEEIIFIILHTAHSDVLFELLHFLYLLLERLDVLGHLFDQDALLLLKAFK